MTEPLMKGIKNRFLQILARFLPGAQSLRVSLHRARGVIIGENVWIGYDVILETSKPHLISIGDNASLGIRSTIIAHFKESASVTIEKNAFIGPGVTILPNVIIGHGAVVTAGSVVSSSIAPMTLAQGNPAIPIAKCGVPLLLETSLKEFTKNLKPLRRQKSKYSEMSKS